MTHVAVIGGGITGLAAAYYLQKAGASVTVIEASDRPGGTIRTERVGGYIIEAGPDSFLTAKPWATELCRELGLDLVPVLSRRVSVLSHGRLLPMPEGMLLTVPARVGPFLRSPLISPLGKLRMAMDLVLPRGGSDDESIADFVRRRLGQEALEKIGEPLMAGIFVASADRLSIKLTFPRFIDMERRHRSLILAARRVKRSRAPMFLSLKHGMSQLVEALASRLRIVYGRPVRRIEKSGEGFRVVAEGHTEVADRVVLATPSHIAAELLPEASQEFRRIPYVDSATVSLGFADARLPEGTGFVIPRGEGRKILACTFSSQKFQGRAPEGHVLVRCFVTDIGRDDLVELCRRELKDILRLSAEPTVSRVFKWPAANPVYEIGHEQRVRRIEAALPRGLAVAGSAYRGIGIPDCVRDARDLAARLVVR